MSENNKDIAITQEPTTDLSSIDLDRVNKFIEEGIPGVATLPDSTLHRIMDLYLSGKSYRQISQSLSIRKDLIMYLSNRFHWYIMRREYLNELEFNMRQRLLEAKLESKDFLLQLTHLWQKKIGSKISKYLLTDDERFANEIDLKEVDRYLKTIDTIHRLSSEGRMDKPSVGLNLGDGVLITKKGDNTVEITPKQKTMAAALQQLADLRREEDNKRKLTKQQGEEVNEDN